MHKRFLVIGFCLVVLFGSLLACGEASNNTGTAVNSNSSSSSGSTPTSAPAQHFKIGQTVKVGSDWQVVVDSAKTSTGSEFNKPQKAGDVYLIITVSMKNISSQEQDASSLLQWSLQDSTGQKYTETIDSDAGSSPDGKVEAGMPLKGDLVYEVPASQKSFTLAFEADLTSSGQTIWEISV
jgi:hypothetical protein